MVSKRGTYALRISGLGEGEHHFSFELDQKFFASFDHPDVQNGTVRTEAVLEKKPGFMAIHFTMKGEVELECDRCLDYFSAAIQASQTIFVKVGETPGELEDDVIMIGKDEHEIEVGQIMYEYIILSLPVQRVHPEDVSGESTCNPEMIKRLNDFSSTGMRKNEKADPRWDALKDIIENKK
jgi:uncharacterized metal-binding protein YceD (DUF177 family)